MTEQLGSTTSGSDSARGVDLAARVQVYFQGILDGACFLYAPANAYKALTGKRVSREHWNRAVARISDPGAFLGGPGATQMRHDEAQLLLTTVLVEFADADETFLVDRLDPSADLASLCREVSIDSVLILAYGGASEFQHPESHVVCGVAASEGPPATLHLACSTAFWGRYLNTGDYSERHHHRLGRWSNDSISTDGEVTISPNFRWRVTVARR